MCFFVALLLTEKGATFPKSALAPAVSHAGMEARAATPAKRAFTAPMRATRVGSPLHLCEEAGFGFWNWDGIQGSSLRRKRRKGEGCYDGSKR